MWRSEHPPGEHETTATVRPILTRCKECCGPSGSRSSDSSRRGFRPEAEAYPRLRSHQSVAPNRHNTSPTPRYCCPKSIRPVLSGFVAEVGDPHPEGVFDHHDLTGAAQHAADVDVDVLARRARGSDHAAF